MLVSQFISYLKQYFPEIDIYNGMIDKNNNCIGVYLRSGLKPYIALGGLENTSFNYKRIDMLVHWSQDANKCETQANKIYDFLLWQDNLYIGKTNK